MREHGSGFRREVKYQREKTRRHSACRTRERSSVSKDSASGELEWSMICDCAIARSEQWMLWTCRYKKGLEEEADDGSAYDVVVVGLVGLNFQAAARSQCGRGSKMGWILVELSSMAKTPRMTLDPSLTAHISGFEIRELLSPYPCSNLFAPF